MNKTSNLLTFSYAAILGIHCLLLSNKGCGDIKQWHIKQLGHQVENRYGYTNGSKFNRAWRQELKTMKLMYNTHLSFSTEFCIETCHVVVCHFQYIYMKFLNHLSSHRKAGLWKRRGEARWFSYRYVRRRRCQRAPWWGRRRVQARRARRCPGCPSQPHQAWTTPAPSSPRP